MGKIVSHQFLDTVLEHIADHEHNKQRPGDIAILHLREPSHSGRKDHCNTGCNTIEDLLHSHSILLLVQADVEIALNELLEHSPMIDKTPVMGHFPIENSVTFLHLVLALLHHHLRKTLSDFLYMRGLLLRIYMSDDPYGLNLNHMSDELIAEPVITAGLIRDSRNIYDCIQRPELTKDSIRVCKKVFYKIVRIRKRGSIPQVGGLIAQSALEDCSKHLQMILIGAHICRLQGCRDLFHGSPEQSQRLGVILGYITEQIGRCYQTDVRLDVTIELLLAVDFRIDIKAVGHEHPGIDGELIADTIHRAVESELELDRKIIVLLCLYRYHSTTYNIHRAVGLISPAGTDPGRVEIPLQGVQGVKKHLCSRTRIALEYIPASGVQSRPRLLS